MGQCRRPGLYARILAKLKEGRRSSNAQSVVLGMNSLKRLELAQTHKLLRLEQSMLHAGKQVGAACKQARTGFHE